MNNNDLKLILNTNISLIVLETHDEGRAIELLVSLFKAQGMSAMRWSVTEGIGPLGFGVELKDAESYCEPMNALKFVKEHRPACAFVLCDFHPYMDEPKIVRMLKDIALANRVCDHKIVFVSHSFKLPPELSRLGVAVSLSMPTDDEIMAIIREEARSWASRNQKNRIKTDNITLQKLVSNLKGLPHQDVRRLAHGAISDDGAISEEDLPEVTKAKFALMDMEGVLHFEYSTAHMNDIAGLERLKGWLADRRLYMTGDKVENATDTPKGVLLFGVQGGGKSLAAKAIAGIWGLPLLRLDMASLFNKFIGETEKNLREALKLADMMAPCVLWVDELEKGMASDGSDSATTKRLLGTLLTWMSERKSRVFIVATSNDISQLPPELMRKGRFDEIFFVDLPDVKTREAIFKIHLQKRGWDYETFDLSQLGESSEGFTGAEIEQVVVSATYAAEKAGRGNQLQVLQAIQQTQPLSVVMAERIHELRAWANERAVLAN